jgi:hypothetical protein
MPETLVAISVKLGRDGAQDIDLLIHSYRVGSPSPCVVIEDFGPPRGIGGSIESLDQILQLVIAEHPGYVVKRRAEVLTNYSTPDPAVAVS